MAGTKRSDKEIGKNPRPCPIVTILPKKATKNVNC